MREGCVEKKKKKRTFFPKFVDHSNSRSRFRFFGTTRDIAHTLVFRNLIDYFCKRRPFRILDFEGGGRERKGRVYESRKHSAFYRIQSPRSFGRERVLVSTRESSIHGNRGPKLFGILDLFFGNERELDTFRLIPR